MRTIRDRNSLRSLRREWCQRPQDRVAFVPTMGALHAGHLSLVEFARERADLVVASIFVNPLQFDDPDDLARYPRDLERDALVLAEAGVDILYAPDVDDMYPPSNADRAGQPAALVRAPAIGDDLEGACRPGHFDGVATVLVKLFNRVGPDLALFGEKDFQQLKVVETLVEMLDIPVDVVGRPTVREADGLAVSSRNVRLPAAQRSTATGLYRALLDLRAELRGVGQAQGKTAALAAIPGACEQARARLVEGGFAPDYCAVRGADDFREPDGGDSDWVIVCAARLGTLRLLDVVRVFD